MSVSTGKSTTWTLWPRALHRAASEPITARLSRNPFRRLPSTPFTIAGAEGPRPYTYKTRPLVRCLPRDSMIEWTNATPGRDPDIDRFTATSTSSEAILGSDAGRDDHRE
jgi:hypothetical protein